MGTLQRLAVSTRRDVHSTAPFERKGTVGAAYAALRKELIRALHEDPSRVVAAPGYGRGVPAAEIVDDDFAGHPEFLHEALQIIGEQASSGNLRASAFIAAIANRHAAFHCDDLAQLLAGEEAA